MQLLTERELHSSFVVANCAMNRERQLSGSNGYERELRIEILSFLRSQSSPVTRVDLCCGSGRALLEAAAILAETGETERCHIEGIDLAGLFHPNPYSGLLALREEGIESWRPIAQYALVTCVHGLHYVGDKLSAIAKAVGSLAPRGLFIANVDLANFRLPDGKPADRTVASRLRRSGLVYDAKRRLIRCVGPRQLRIGLSYLGADDKIGPNYTGQSAVDSYYDLSPF